MSGLLVAPQRLFSEAKLQDALDSWDRGMLGGSPSTRSLYGWTVGVRPFNTRTSVAGDEQPVLLPDAMIAWSGEIFNQGVRPDGEVLASVLETPDFEGFHSLDGFWSVVRVTPEGPQVFTDHLGLCPMYYWPEFQIASSDLESMFYLVKRPKLDEVYLSNCIKFGYDYSGRTPYKGIYQMPPGSVLDLATGSIKRYWQWSKVRGEPKDLKVTLDNAIQNRLYSDHEVVMLLSGGLDSSIVYYSLKEHYLPIRAFSIENGESQYLPEGVEFLDVGEVSLSEAVRIMQAPLDLGSLLPQIAAAQALRDKGVKVCLTGDGADELFGGYARAQQYDSQASDIFCELPYYHLPRLDRVMANASIQARTPYLAPSVVATALRLPRSYRTMKQALKAAYGSILPPEIVLRYKQPWKSREVVSGGLQYRVKLVEEFRNAQTSL